MTSIKAVMSHWILPLSEAKVDNAKYSFIMFKVMTVRQAHNARSVFHFSLTKWNYQTRTVCCPKAEGHQSPSGHESIARETRKSERDRVRTTMLLLFGGKKGKEEEKESSP